MPVRGARAVAAAFYKAPAQLRENLEDAIQQAADLVLVDMRRMTPKDTGALAGALAKAFSDTGLSARIGLVNRRATEQFFYARFYEEGTKGGQVRYRPRRGKAKTATMNVPARAARPFMKPALDLNRREIEQMVRNAVAAALRGRRMRGR